MVYVVQTFHRRAAVGYRSVDGFSADICAEKNVIEFSAKRYYFKEQSFCGGEAPSYVIAAGGYSNSLRLLYVSDSTTIIYE